MVGAGLRANPAQEAGALSARPRRQPGALGPMALEVRQLRASYGGTEVLTGLDIDVRSGELVTLLGANGSGKSTALRCLAGLRAPDSGSASLFGEPLGNTRLGDQQRVAMVFQQPALVRRLSVLDNVCSGALGRLNWRQSACRQLFPSALREEAMRCLDRVGLSDLAAAQAGRLSGGQQQRVAVARALCQRARLLLADEPVSALDPAAAEQVLSLLADLAHTDGLAVLTVLHQPDLARRYSDRIIGLLRGNAVFDLRSSKVTHAAVSALYASPSQPGPAA